MASYRFEILDEDEVPVGVSERDCKDDLSALEFARTLCKHNAVHVWDGARLVAHLNCEDAAHTSAQAQAG
jgi:hypothetical protein